MSNIISYHKSYTKNNKYRLLLLYFTITNSAYHNTVAMEIMSIVNTAISTGFLFAAVGIIGGIVSKRIKEQRKIVEAQEEAFQKSKEEVLSTYIKNKKDEVEYKEKIRNIEKELVRLKWEQKKYMEQLAMIERIKIKHTSSLLLEENEEVAISKETATKETKINEVESLSPKENNYKKKPNIKEEPSLDYSLTLKKDGPLILMPIKEEESTLSIKETNDPNIIPYNLKGVKWEKIEIPEMKGENWERIENPEMDEFIIKENSYTEKTEKRNIEEIHKNMEIMLMFSKMENLKNKVSHQIEDKNQEKILIEKRIEKISKENTASLYQLFNGIAQYVIAKEYLHMPTKVTQLSRRNMDEFVNKMKENLNREEEIMSQYLENYETNLYNGMLRILQDNMEISRYEKYVSSDYWYDRMKFINIVNEYELNNGKNYGIYHEKYLAINALRFLKDKKNPLSFDERSKKTKFIIAILEKNPHNKLSPTVMSALLSYNVNKYIKIVHKIQRSTESFAMLLLLSTILKKMKINSLVEFDTNSMVEEIDYQSIYLYELILNHRLFDSPYILKMLKNINHFHRIEIEMQGGNPNYTIGNTQYNNIMPQLIRETEEHNKSLDILSIDQLLNIALVFFGRKEEYKSSITNMTKILDHTQEAGANMYNFASAISNGTS